MPTFNKCTITVNQLKIPSSVSGLVWLFTEDNLPSAATDGGDTSIFNGGGNLRCYTDSTKATQLPIHVVTFQTGSTPKVQVWGRSASLAVGGTVYIEADDTATVQPLPTNTYGQYAVYSDCIIASLDGQSDASRALQPVANGALTTEDGFLGDTEGGAKNNVGTEYLTFNNITVGSEWTLICWGKPFRDNARMVSLGLSTSSGNQANLATDGSGNLTYQRNGTNPLVSGNISGATEYDFYAARESATLDNMVWSGDGTNKSITTYDSSFPTLDRARLYMSADTTPFGSADTSISGAFIYSDGLTEDHLLALYNNQSSPSTFWSTSAWEPQGVTPPTSTPIHILTTTYLGF